MTEIIERRWEQHRRDGGKLTLEQFTKRKPRGGKRRRRERDFPHDLKRLPLDDRRALATEILDDLPDGAFFAAAEDMFGLEAEDWIDE